MAQDTISCVSRLGSVEKNWKLQQVKDGVVVRDCEYGNKLTAEGRGLFWKLAGARGRQVFTSRDHLDPRDRNRRGLRLSVYYLRYQQIVAGNGQDRYAINYSQPNE